MMRGALNGGDGGVMVEARLHAAAADAAQLARAIAVLEKLGSGPALRLLERLLAISEQAPAVVASVADAVDGLAARAMSGGIDWDERLRLLARILQQLTEPKALRLVASIVEQMPSAPSSVNVPSSGDASVGPLGMLRALNEPEVRRSMGFALGVARRFGALLAGGGFAPALSARSNPTV